MDSSRDDEDDSDDNVIFQRNQRIRTSVLYRRSADIVPGMEGDDAIMRCFDLSVKSYNDAERGQAEWSPPSSNDRHSSVINVARVQGAAMPGSRSKLKTEKTGDNAKDTDDHQQIPKAR